MEMGKNLYVVNVLKWQEIDFTFWLQVTGIWSWKKIVLDNIIWNLKEVHWVIHYIPFSLGPLSLFHCLNNIWSNIPSKRNNNVMINILYWFWAHKNVRNTWILELLHGAQCSNIYFFSLFTYLEYFCTIISESCSMQLTIFKKQYKTQAVTTYAAQKLFIKQNSLLRSW